MRLPDARAPMSVTRATPRARDDHLFRAAIKHRAHGQVKNVTFPSRRDACSPDLGWYDAPSPASESAPMTQAAVDAHGADLREYLRVLRARKAEVGLVILVLLVATMFFDLRRTPLYEGAAEVLVNPIQNPTSAVSVPQQPNLDTERQLVLSAAVAATARDELGTVAPLKALLQPLTVNVITDTDVLDIRYDSPSPAMAATRANAFANAYVAFRTGQAISNYQA